MRTYEKYEKKKPETFSKRKFSWKRIRFFYKGFLDSFFSRKLHATRYHVGTELILYYLLCTLLNMQYDRKLHKNTSFKIYIMLSNKI